MVLGLTPEAYAVYRMDYGPGSAHDIVHMSNGLVFFTSFLEAKNAAQDFIDSFGGVNLPMYVWVAPVYKLWINGEL